MGRVGGGYGEGLLLVKDLWLRKGEPGNGSACVQVGGRLLIRIGENVKNWKGHFEELLKRINMSFIF